MCVKPLSWVWLFWDPVDCNPPGSSVHWIFQARILEWVVISSSRGSSLPGDWTHISCIGRWILYHWAPWEPPWGIRALTRRDTREVILLSDIWGYGKKIAPWENGNSVLNRHQIGQHLDPELPRFKNCENKSIVWTTSLWHFVLKTAKLIKSKNHIYMFVEFLALWM